MKDRSSFEPKSTIWINLAIYGAVTIFLTITIFAYKFADIPFDFFSRDRLSIHQTHPLTGIQSNLGVLIWVCTAGTCLFTSAVLRSRKATESASRFFMWSGIITLVLTLDDLFLISEDLAYRYLEIGEKTLFLVYVILIGWYIFKFRETIPHSEHLLFILALIFFGLSEGMDMMEESWVSPWRVFLEEGFKLFGIVSWSVYLIRECFRFITTS